MLAALSWMSIATAATLAEVRALVAEQRHAEAMVELDAYIRAEPEDVEARLLKGVILTRAGHTEEALAVFEALASERPDLPEPLNNLAVLHAARGRYELAREALTRAIELAPRYDTAHENLGDVYVKLANLAYERAYSLNRRNEMLKDKAQWMTRVLDTNVDGDATAAPADAPVDQHAMTPTEEDQPAPPGGGAAVVAAAPMTLPCRTVTGIDSVDAASAMVAWFVGKGVTARADVVSEPNDVIYAVYVPPFDDREAAEEAVRRMRRDGIVDIMRIKTGELANGISVGVYRNRGNAERRVAILSALGYRADLRPQRHGRSVLRVDVRENIGGEIESAFSAAFPDYTLRASNCS